MIKHLRKAVSILLLLTMALSFCSMAICVSAEEQTEDSKIEPASEGDSPQETVALVDGTPEAPTSEAGSVSEETSATDPQSEAEQPVMETENPSDLKTGEEPSVSTPPAEDEPVTSTDSEPSAQPDAEIQATGDRGTLHIVQWIALKSRVTFSYIDGRDNSRHTFASTNMHIRTITDANGKVCRAFCIEPVLGVADGGSYKENNQDDAWMYGLNANQRNAILLILAYGEKYRTSASNGYEDAAIQVLVWEIISGQRNSMFPYNVVTGNTATNKSSIYTAAFGDGTGAYAPAKTLYEEITSRLLKHNLVPSFTSKRQASAPTHSMTYDAARNLYTITLTDTNSVLGDFNFTIDGATVARTGNNLKIETSDISKVQDKVFSATGHTLDMDSAGSVLVWAPYSDSDTIHQTVVCYNGGKPDPVRAYFKLQPGTTNLEIVKQSSDGNVANITFTVKNSAGVTLFSGQTDAQGKLTVPNLNIGDTVTVTETVPEGYISENRTQTITLAAGTNTLTFRNYPVGDGTLQKTSEDGDVEGYYFRLYRHKDSDAGIASKTWCGRSDAVGNVYLTNGEFEEPDGQRVYTFTDLTDGKYSLRELLSMYGAGDVLTESITIQTSGGVTEACDLVFTGDSLHVDDNGDVYVTAVPLTGLTGGGHLTITIHNKPILVPGSLTVKKVNPQKQPLSGTVFLLEYSTDNGANWAPVFSRDTESEPVPGGCTSEGLMDGTLTTGADGLAAFTGLFTDRKDTIVRYRLAEIKTAPGYSLLTEPVFEGTLSKDTELDLSYTVVNAPDYEMPMTGGTGFRAAALAAALAVLAGTALWIARRRKSRC